MVFKCSCCGEAAKLNKNDPDEYSQIAYDHIMDWSDFTSPDDITESWNRSDTIPQVNTRRIVQVYFPFCFEKGEEFNVLFRPALSHFNGWEEYPEELSHSAVVKCRFDEVITFTEENAFIYVTVKQVTMLDKLHEKYPLVTVYGSPYSQKRRYDTVFEYGRYTIYDQPYEDFGSWQLFYTDDSGVPHMVLSCSWYIHGAEITVGNKIFIEGAEK